MEKIIDRYVMVKESTVSETPKVVTVNASDINPHATRIKKEHNYCGSGAKSTQSKRKLPRWMSDSPGVSVSVQKNVPDGVFNYASCVLNDGLLFLELRDAVHKGVGSRVIRCWKYMLLHVTQNTANIAWKLCI